MDPYRTRKLNQSILEVLSDLLQVAVKDPRVGFVTLSRVKLNRDHSVAEVFWSIMGDEQETKQSLEGLKRARGFMQGKVGRLLGLRQVPQLRFVHDDSLARGLEMDDLLRKLEQEGEFLTEDQKRRQLKLEDLQPPSELIQGLRNVGSCWIVPHFNPDPDAMGSALALAEALVAMGRQVRVFGYPDPPTGLSDLPGFASTVSSEDAAELYAQEKPDTLILVDCHRVDRCGSLEDLLDRFETRLCIDHHLVSNRKAPDPGWVEWRACSTCTLVHQVIQVLAAGGGAGGDEPFELSLDMATNLFAGLLNDTGGFRFNNTMPLTFDLAGRLSAMGVDTGQVAHMTLHRYRPVGLALLELVLATFKYYAGGQILLARATQEMLAETGGLLSDTEGFVNIATAVDGVRFVAFMKEIESDTWRVSLRAREQGDVQTIAARYGGGGHKQAAGCTIPGESAEVVSMIVADLTAALES